MDLNAIPNPQLLGVVVGTGAMVSQSKTRVADTNAYAAGDAIATATSSGVSLLTFSNCARALGGSGYVIDSLLLDDANQATKGQFELWLFDTAVADANDNAAFAPTDAELLTLVGVLQFNTPFVGHSGSGATGNCAFHAEHDKLPLRFTCGAASRDLFGVLVVRNAYTPTSGEVFSVRLKIDQD